MHHRTICCHINLADFFPVNPSFTAHFANHDINRMYDCILEIFDSALWMLVFISNPRKYIQTIMLLRIDHGCIGKLLSCLPVNQGCHYCSRTDINYNTITVCMLILHKFWHIAFCQNLVLSLFLKRLYLNFIFAAIFPKATDFRHTGKANTLCNLLLSKYRTLRL